MNKLEEQIKRKITGLKALAAADRSMADKLMAKGDSQNQLAAQLQDILDKTKEAPPMSMKWAPGVSSGGCEAFAVAAIGRENDQDIEFLLQRSMKAGVITCEPGRDTGASSNSIVAIAYGLSSPSNQQLPADQSDLDACHKMWGKLPKHRKHQLASQAYERAIRAIHPQTEQ